MKARELVATIEKRGGTLTLHGDKIRFRVPQKGADLIDAVRAQSAAVIAYLRQRVGLPWPTYNGGMQFRCDRCNAHFDTSCGFAKHQVVGCLLHERRTGGHRCLEV